MSFKFKSVIHTTKFNYSHYLILILKINPSYHIWVNLENLSRFNYSQICATISQSWRNICITLSIFTWGFIHILVHFIFFKKKFKSLFWNKTSVILFELFNQKISICKQTLIIYNFKHVQASNDALCYSI